jgi:hypothetical protein
MTMQFGISIPAFADFSDPRVLAELAQEAESTGWDGSIMPEEWRELLAYIQKHRTSTMLFDAVHSGATPGDNASRAIEMIQPYADAGVTWWIEPVDPRRFGWSYEVPWAPEATVLMRERVRQGPPRL